MRLRFYRLTLAAEFFGNFSSARHQAQGRVSVIPYLGQGLTSYTYNFWVAFIFTRPCAAIFGDLITKPASNGDVHFGRGIAALIAATVLGIVISYSRKKASQKI